WARVEFFAAIEQATGIDVAANSDDESLAAEVRKRELDVHTDGRAWFAVADDLLSKYVEPSLIAPSFVVDYPVEISPLAREHRARPRLVERFEAFAGGMEIANGF